jgi:putative ATPase
VATDEADARGESYAAGSVAWVSDLFAAASGDVPPTDATMRPLAVRMRPRTIEEVRGQGDVLRQGSPLRRLIEGSGGAAGPLSAILWGPPGTGKTTLANLVATAADREFVELSAVTAGVKDVRAVMDGANRARDLYGRQTVLFLDEIHRFTKAQQDALLPGVENRQVILVAATTENPSFSVIAPLLSRSMLITLTSLTDEEVADVLDSAAADERGLAAEFVLADEARDHLVRMSGGDARRALTALEAAAGVAQDGIPLGAEPERPVTITLADTEQAIAHAAVRYDRAGDQHYDVASALIKSMRGSDVDAALHYLARMLEAGEDPRFIARRIVIAASEDVGMGDPTALADRRRGDACGGPDRDARGQDHPCSGRGSQRAGAQVERRLCGHQRGDRRRPRREGRRGPGSPARKRVCRCRADQAGLRQGVGRGKAKAYVYAHDEPDGVAAQQYLPDDLQKAMQEHSYYRPTDRGFEARLQERWAWLRARLGRG